MVSPTVQKYGNNILFITHIYFIVFVIPFILFFFPINSFAATKSVLSPTEQWVLEQLRIGKIADLKKKYPDDPQKRKISSSFLENILTGSIEGIPYVRFGVNIEYATIIGPVSLRNTEVKYEVVIKYSNFTSDVDISGSVFRNSLSLSGSTFLHSANFKNMVIIKDVHFESAVFSGQADFTGMNVSNSFIAYNAKFTSKKDNVSFVLMKAGSTAILSGIQFAGPVAFDGSQFMNYVATSVKFENSATFDFMKAESISIQFSEFYGNVSFTGVQILSAFVADNTKFKSIENRSNLLYFNHMKVGGSATFQYAIFNEYANFTNTKITGHCTFDSAKFNSKKESVSFDNMNIGGYLALVYTSFSGSVSLNNANIMGGVVIIGGNKLFDNPRSIMIDVSNSTVSNEFKIEDISIKSLLATYLNVKGHATFKNLRINNKANFSYAKFTSVNFTEVIWPNSAQDFRLDNMGYDYISIGSDNTTWQSLIKLVDRASYSVNAYNALENYFKRTGYPSRADSVFIAQKRRERNETLEGSAWLASLFSDILVQYGRRPSLAFAWSFLFIMIGCLIFYRRENMEPVRPEYSSYFYNGFWYSLDLFLPFVSLGMANAWQPTKNRWFMHNYIRVHILIGWILIPVGLAALTGFIQ